ncbi:MAG: hypothetical protein KGJ13_07185 [Patescibacteria group bacterium]|nr:hypothetical protein [Patescibacteria group bacterium]
MANEITQEQFDKASELFERIYELQSKKRRSGSLEEKLQIQFEISKLIAERNGVLGL